MKVRIGKKKSLQEAVAGAIDAIVEAPPVAEPVSSALKKEEIDKIPGIINQYGVKILPDGSQWVIHCVSGEALERGSSEPIRDIRGNVFWKRKGEAISQLDIVRQVLWGNPERFTI